MIIAAAYLRVSKSDNTDNDESLTVETQRRRIRALCEARGWTYGPEYIDEGISATKARGTGTQWQEMLSHVGTGKFDVVVARDLDRLLRTLQDLVKLIDLGVKVATVDGEIDLTTADGEFRATMLAAVARFEIRRKSERAIGANETRRKLGIPISRGRILGYDEDGVTQIDDEAAAVKRAFEDYLAGVKITHIANELNAQGFTTAKGNPWSHSNLRSLLTNTRYKGVISKWDPTKKAPLGSRVARYSDETYQGAFEPIVSAEVFDAVQEKLADPARKRAWDSAPKYLLSGIAKCGKCNDGTRLVSSYYQRSPYVKKRTGERVTFPPVRLYVCKAKKHLSRNAEQLDDFIEDVMKGRILKGEDLLRVFGPKVKKSDATLTNLKFERIALQERLDGLAELYAEGLLTQDKVREQSKRLRARLAELNQLLIPPSSNAIYQLLTSDDPIATWEEMPIARKRPIIAQLLDITVLPAERGSKGFREDLVKVAWIEPTDS